MSGYSPRKLNCIIRSVLAGQAQDLIKSIVFGVAVNAIALYQGFECQATPEGVSRATTRTVVISSLTILGLDFILTALMFSV